ncbi:Armadillo repeat-containing protein 8 [Boothiomyces sp. JEL0838]|nr:Armadillo repeat-containing protein 8 [Boothiomyces sp. JEL0838]
MTIPNLSTQQKSAQAVLVLESKSTDQLLEALRFIKNSIIGNPTRKEHYLKNLGIAPKLVDCLIRYKSDAELMGEIAPIIGSLAQYDVSILIEAGVLLPLFEALDSQDIRVLEATARALRSVVQHPLSIPLNSITNAHIYNLVTLSKPPQSKPAISNIAEISISILARLANSESERDRISNAGGIPILVEWLNDKWSHTSRVQESALDALASLCKSSTSLGETISHYKTESGKSVSYILFKLLHDKRPLMRLGAATCITYLYKTRSLPIDFQDQITHQLLSCVVRLFDDTSSLSSQLGVNITTVQERAIALFAYLMDKDAKLQVAALEGDAITRLVRIFTNCTPSVTDPGIVCGDKTIESLLQAVAAVSSITEECRRQIIDLKLIPHIVGYLEHPNVAIRIAACNCARSLSRSVKSLRTSLMDAGIALPLFKLLFDSDLNVQITATATVCNIVLDFSPMKKIIIEQGGVKQLVALVKSNNHELKLNAAWALKNMLFNSDLETKKNVIFHLGWDGLARLIHDADVEIQTQALNLLRNMACAKIPDIDFVLQGFGRDNLLNTLESKLITMAEYPQIILHNHENDQVRVGCIWCIINLTWAEDPSSGDRVNLFKRMGAETKLKIMSKNDVSLDVRDRAQTALSNLAGNTGVYQSHTAASGPEI